MRYQEGLLKAQNHSLERLTLTQNLFHLFAVSHRLLLVTLMGKTRPLLPPKFVVLKRKQLYSMDG